MTEKTELPDEAVSLAGRILAAGNPRDNEQVIVALMRALPRYSNPADIRAALDVVLKPYFDNALSLAGYVLGSEGDEEEEQLPRGPAPMAATGTIPILPPGEEIHIHSLETREATLGLLKGLHPNGSTWAHLAIALDIRGSDLTPVANELRTSGAVRMEDAAVFASLETMADKSIRALPWPEREIG